MCNRLYNLSRDASINLPNGSFNFKTDKYEGCCMTGECRERNGQIKEDEFWKNFDAVETLNQE